MNTTISQTFYDLSIKGIDGETINLSDYKEQNVLIVNVASFCGYTSQYTELQKLHDSFPNLTVIGVPCNQFGFQEPGNAKEIQNFCQSKYSIDFVLTEKTKVKGKDKHELYKWLTEKSLNGKDDFSVSWNFNKFLVNSDGQLVDHFGSGVSPMDSKITSQIR
ncbi:MAG: glutathione peroxidase [Flavobacteriales bacterium]